MIDANIGHKCRSFDGHSKWELLVTHPPLTPVAWFHLPKAALSSLTQATIPSGSVKCVTTSKQWVAAVEDCRCKLLPGVALALWV